MHACMHACMHVSMYASYFRAFAECKHEKLVRLLVLASFRVEVLGFRAVRALWFRVLKELVP